MKNSCLIGCSTQAVGKLVKYKAICSTTITGFTPLKSSQVFQHFPSPLRNRQGKGGLCQLLLHVCRGRTQGNILSEMPGEWLVACAYLELLPWCVLGWHPISSWAVELAVLQKSCPPLTKSTLRLWYLTCSAACSHCHLASGLVSDPILKQGRDDGHNWPTDDFLSPGRDVRGEILVIGFTG